MIDSVLDYLLLISVFLLLLIQFNFMLYFDEIGDPLGFGKYVESTLYDVHCTYYTIYVVQNKLKLQLNSISEADFNVLFYTVLYRENHTLTCSVSIREAAKKFFFNGSTIKALPPPLELYGSRNFAVGK